jgi:hypothetical protein
MYDGNLLNNLINKLDVDTSEIPHKVNDYEQLTSEHMYAISSQFSNLGISISSDLFQFMK